MILEGLRDVLNTVILRYKGARRCSVLGQGDEENLCGVMKLKNSIVAKSRESGSMLSKEYLEF